MAFRVTNNIINARFVDQINKNKVNLEATRNQIATGLSVENASDDPGRSGTLVTLQNTISRLTKHKERIGFATDSLAAQETALNSGANIMIRLKELATQAANETYSPEIRAQIADEVWELRDALAAVANTTYQGFYIFGGLDENDPPVDFQANYFDEPATSIPPEARGHWVFDDSAAAIPDPNDPNMSDAGQAATRTIAISDTESIRINTAASSIFKVAMDAATQLGRALEGFETTRDVNDDLVQTGNNPQLTFPAGFATQSAQIREALDAIERGRSTQLETELSSLGARTNRLQQTTEILTTLIASADQSRGTIQEADPIKAASDFANLQISLEALLASGSQINNLSLLNFL